MKRLILITLLIIMFAPDMAFSQETQTVPRAPASAMVFSQETQPVPRVPAPAQGNLAQGANIAARARNIDLRARELDEQARNLEMRGIEIEERTRNLDMRERELDEFAENLEMRKREIEGRTRDLEIRETEMKSPEKTNNKELQPLLFLILVVNILCAVWVYQDIQKRARESGIWIVIALITGLLGTLVYAIVRLGDNAKNKA